MPTMIGYGLLRWSATYLEIPMPRDLFAANNNRTIVNGINRTLKKSELGCCGGAGSQHGSPSWAALAWDGAGHQGGA